jgi:hypothetical protein
MFFWAPLLYIHFFLAEQTFFKEDLTWIEAQRCCASKSGQLATMDDNDNTVSCHNIPNESTDLKIWTGKIRRHSEWIEYLGKIKLIVTYTGHTLEYLFSSGWLYMSTNELKTINS